MSWREEIRDAFERAGHAADDTVIEELGDHAQDLEQALHDGGRTEAGVREAVRQQIAVWAREGLRRPAARSAAPTPGVPARGVGAILRDVGYALRLIRRRPGPAFVGIITIACGVTAVVLVASIVRGVLLTPLPWPESDRLLRIYEGRRGGSNRFGQVGPIVTNGTYLAWREQRTTIEDVAAWTAGEATWVHQTAAERLRLARITPNLTSVLRTAPRIGRGLVRQDAIAGAHHVALVSAGFWRERLASRADVVGAVLLLDGEPHTIVGVMDDAFVFPDRHTRVWVPLDVPPVIQPGRATARSGCSARSRGCGRDRVSGRPRRRPRRGRRPHPAPGQSQSRCSAVTARPKSRWCHCSKTRRGR